MINEILNLVLKIGSDSRRRISGYFFLPKPWSMTISFKLDVNRRVKKGQHDIYPDNYVFIFSYAGARKGIRKDCKLNTI